MKWVVFDHAKNMGIAHWSFIAGHLLTMICGIRVVLRTLQFLQKPHPWNSKWWMRPDPVMNFILEFRLHPRV